jgi:polyisoprenoid-binding protein YceI
MNRISRIFVFMLFTALFAGACSNSSNQNKQDACACAKASLASPVDTLLMKSCDEQRKTDSIFEKDYQHCLLAERVGLDTSKVSLSEADSTKGFNLPSAVVGNYTIDATKSKVNWLARKVTGEHKGSVGVKSGELLIQGDRLRSGTIVIDMTSIQNSDQTGEEKSKLEKHLKGSDFFATDKYPDASFTIKSATAKNKHMYEVVGDLTIKGITHEQKISLTVTPGGRNMVNVAGAIPIDRTLYDIKYRSGKFFSDLGDTMIEDIFFITLALKGNSQTANP